MRKVLFVSVVCAILVGFVGLPALQAVDAPKGPMDVTLPAGVTPTQEKCKFDHGGGHAKLECKACHHKEEGGAIKKCAAAGCHDNPDPKDKTSEKSFYKAYHDMKSTHSCMGCHKAEGKGPAKCTDCHPKKGA